MIKVNLLALQVPCDNCGAHFEEVVTFGEDTYDCTCTNKKCGAKITFEVEFSAVIIESESFDAGAEDD